MSVDTATVARIASLARIKVSEGELEAMVPELNGILDWVEQLGEVNVEGVEPMTAVIPNKLRLREDVVNADPLTGAAVYDGWEYMATPLGRPVGAALATIKRINPRHPHRGQARSHRAGVKTTQTVVSTMLGKMVEMPKEEKMTKKQWEKEKAKEKFGEPEPEKEDKK